MSTSQLSQSQLSVLQQLEKGDTAVFLVGLHTQAADIFYQGIEIFEEDCDFQTVMFAHLIADRWLSFFQVPEGTVIILKALEQDNLELARYDLANGFSARSLQAFIRQHTLNAACMTVSA